MNATAASGRLSWLGVWGRLTTPARGSLVLLIALYLSAAAAPVIAPYHFATQHRQFPNCPPTRIHLNPPGRWWREGVTYVHPLRLVDPYRRLYAEDTTRRIPLRWLSGGRLVRTADPGAMLFLLGTDGLGRDLFSRIVYGGRVSLSIGLVGVAISMSVGLAIGAVSGYLGGWIDNAIMRLTEVLMALPSFYLLLALAAVIPPSRSPAQTFLLIVVIMSFIRWAGFARIIRGMAASLREQEYVQAARALGATPARVIVRHVVPGTIGYTIVAATLSIPGFILGESALSLLGLGIQEPSTSWGNLLADAQNVRSLVSHPWILTPGVFIFAAIMAFNFLGDSLRDILDPRHA